MKNVFFSVFLVLIASSLFSQEKGSFEDRRDNQWYKYVTIGEQVWMAENLNYKTTEGSWCYGEARWKEEKCEVYGKLYNWKAAENVCPNGWRLPSKEDYQKLVQHYGNYQANTAAGMKATDGFNLKLGGYRGAGGHYEWEGTAAYFWTSTMFEGSSKNAYHIGVVYHVGDFGKSDINDGRSVRCIKNK